MKKPTYKTASRRKLALRREAVALLTPIQLGNVVGGDDLVAGDGGGDGSVFAGCTTQTK